MITLFLAAGIGVSSHAAAQMYAPKPSMAPSSKEGYTEAKASANAQYKFDKAGCASLGGNARDVCNAEAKGRENVAKADAEAAYENTPKARENARVVYAQANHDVAVEKCDDRAGNRKDVCVKEARAALVRAKADAKVDRVASDTRNDAAARQFDARSHANTDRRDAEYDVAIEQCRALAGTARDACVSSAKLQYGKS